MTPASNLEYYAKFKERLVQFNVHMPTVRSFSHYLCNIHFAIHQSANDTLITHIAQNDKTQPSKIIAKSTEEQLSLVVLGRISSENATISFINHIYVQTKIDQTKTKKQSKVNIDPFTLKFIILTKNK